MKNKWNILAVCTFAIALGIFVLTYFLYHYMGPDGRFLPVPQSAPGKPFVTLLFGIWGVMFLFSSVISVLIGMIFCPKNKTNP